MVYQTVGVKEFRELFYYLSYLFKWVCMIYLISESSV
jgi:hypothetical protein